ncbi:MAG TPA: hypothetical protein PK574_02895 [Fervidobacterium sp.]|nr:hypothetical protein [Fervidobacterium sp.]HPT53856.1 hypothetical protein [Fervidobacterium sp.]
MKRFLVLFVYVVTGRWWNWVRTGNGLAYLASAVITCPQVNHGHTTHFL